MSWKGDNLRVVFLLVILLIVNPVQGFYLNGTLKNASDSTPINGGLISYGINNTYSNATGFYSLNNITNGTRLIYYSFNPKFYSNSTNVTISGNTIKNANLTLKPTGTITGCVWWGSYSCFKESVVFYSTKIRWFF